MSNCNISSFSRPLNMFALRYLRRPSPRYNTLRLLMVLNAASPTIISGLAFKLSSSNLSMPLNINGNKAGIWLLPKSNRTKLTNFLNDLGCKSLISFLDKINSFRLSKPRKASESITLILLFPRRRTLRLSRPANTPPSKRTNLLSIKSSVCTLEAARKTPLGKLSILLPLRYTLLSFSIFLKRINKKFDFNYMYVFMSAGLS